MDLANRAYKLRESPTGLNNNWVIRVGDIHMSFSVLHCIGKTVEGSGLDTCAIDSGTYSAAALRGIFGEKMYKIGVEYH